MTEAIEDDHPRSRYWGVRLVVAGLVLSVLSKYSDQVGLPVSPDRLLIPAGVGLLFLGGHLRVPGGFRWRWVHTLMAATVAWIVWSAVGAGTLTTSEGFYALADRVAVPFVLFALAPLVFRTEDDRRLLLKALIGLGFYLGLIAIFEMVGPTALVFPSYIADPTIGDVFGRARGPYVSAEANGMLMAAALFAALVGALRFRRAWRVVSVLTVPLCALGVLLTLTRSVWVGTVLGLLVVCLITPTLRRRLPLLAGGMVATVGVVLLTVPEVTRLVVERLTTQRSVYDRANTNAAALRMVEENPLEGIGWSRFIQESADWVRQSDAYPVTNVNIEVHNVVLSRAAELGLIGAALWLACVFAGPVRAALSRPARQDLADWRVILVGFGCVWGVVIMLSPLPYPLPNTLIFLMAGIVLRNHLLPRRDEVAAAPADAPGQAAGVSP
ncbi:O-antigen ligase family protein [Geodermatophilus sp. SYSU D00815]